MGALPRAVRCRVMLSPDTVISMVPSISRPFHGRYFVLSERYPVLSLSAVLMPYSMLSTKAHHVDLPHSFGADMMLSPGLKVRTLFSSLPKDAAVRLIIICSAPLCSPLRQGPRLLPEKSARAPLRFAVSYTHLDVYKRQHSHCALLLAGNQAAVFKKA